MRTSDTNNAPRWEIRMFMAFMCLIALVVVPLSFSACKTTTTGSSLGTTSAMTNIFTTGTNTITLTTGKLQSNVCYACHNASTPGITQQFESSVMAQKGVTCFDCHQVPADYPGAQAHFGTYRLVSPTPATCQKCHPDQVSQFQQGRHSLPAFVAVNGVSSLTPAELAMYQAVPEGGFDPSKTEHPLAALEGNNLLSYTCNTCHQIGQPNADGSVGRCQSCHLTHTFSLEQARKPETCSACHIGPDHPQWEIFQESAHGIKYATLGAAYNWNAAPGALTIKDMPAPTCAVCHISAIGNVPGSHDVGARLTNFLAAQYTTARPDAAANGTRMQMVCLQCHASDFVTNFYAGANQVTSTVTGMLKQADTIIAPLKAKGLYTATPFDQPIKFIYFDIWHDYGRTAKFGAWMQGPDYSQWHGAYEILRNLAVLQSMVNDELAAASK